MFFLKHNDLYNYKADKPNTVKDLLYAGLQKLG